MNTTSSVFIVRSCSVARLFLATLFCLHLVGCKSLNINVPVYVQQIKQQEATLLIMVENQSSHQVKVTYPIASGLLPPHQHVVFPVANPGSHRIVVSAYSEDKRFSDVLRSVKTVEFPVFLNGNDLIGAAGQYVGYQLVVTDGMLFAY